MAGRVYSPREYTDMMACYGEAGYSIPGAVRIYRQRYPNRRHPGYNVIRNLVARPFFGGILPRRGQRGGRPRFIRAELEELVIDAFRNNGRLHLRAAARRFRFSKETVRRILRRDRLRVFRDPKTQKLLFRDYAPRVHFCTGLLAQIRRMERIMQRIPRAIPFLHRILFTDEVIITPNGVYNTRNNIYWAEHNPHLTRATNFQFRWSVYVWAGVIGDRVVK